MALRPDHPPRFKRWLPPAATKRMARREFRPPPQERGLDERWNRMSRRYRRQNPFCRMCEQEGQDAVLVDVVDHIKPRLEYPDLTYEWRNCQGLCRRHDGLKARLEAYARETGQLEKLPFWCAALENRPAAVMAIPPELWIRESPARS